MPLMPARVKYRKMHRGSRSGMASRGATVAFGEYGLQSLERCWLDTKQIEAARVAVTRYMKRRGKVWLRIFPDKSFTKKPLETRMGKGKGPLESWVAVIRPANVLIEVDGVTEAVARESLRLAAMGRDLRQEMFNLRLQQASSQLEKPARLRDLRKDIARIETRISQLGRKAS